MCPESSELSDPDSSSNDVTVFPLEFTGPATANWPVVLAFSKDLTGKQEEHAKIRVCN